MMFEQCDLESELCEFKF